MNSYENLINNLLIGDTPKQKFEYLQSITDLLIQIAYPPRGEVSADIFDYAKKIQEVIPHRFAVEFEIIPLT